MNNIRFIKSVLEDQNLNVNPEQNIYNKNLYALKIEFINKDHINKLNKNGFIIFKIAANNGYFSLMLEKVKNEWIF